MMFMHRKEKLIACVLALGLSGHCGASKSVDNGYVQEKIKSEIKRQLSERSSADHQQLKNTIQKNVNHELKRSGYTPKKHKRHGHKAHHAKKHGKRYLLPQWPYYSAFYEKSDFVQLLADYSIASRAYGSSGRTKDYSVLLFGTDKIAVRDILLVSKLAETAKIQDGAAGPAIITPDSPSHEVANYAAVAPQLLNFDAWESRFGVALNVARHYCHNDLSVGIHIPVVGKTHRIRLASTPTAANIIGAGKTLQDLVTQILLEKNSSFNDRTSTQVGLGDINGYMNFNIHSRHIDRFILGAHLVLPSAREGDTDKLWAHDLGNGGFVQLSGFFSMLWEKSCWFNPYIHSKAGYSFASRVTRRIAQKLSKTGNGTALPREFVLGKNLRFLADPNGLFTEPDSTIKRFGNSVTKIKIHQGPELLIRLGNAFTGIFGKGGAFDIHYDLKVKGRDYLGSQRNGEQFDGSNLNYATWSVGHILGAQYSYQFSDSFRTGFAGSYAVAGRNYPKELAFNLDLNFEF
ncbi:hypothetical protein JST56_00080 [Candidatus Dependentiae bacterium]|nr:hypothetical protein [Candidatus Dependentiae bacterium]